MSDTARIRRAEALAPRKKKAARRTPDGEAAIPRQRESTRPQQQLAANRERQSAERKRRIAEKRAAQKKSLQNARPERSGTQIAPTKTAPAKKRRAQKAPKPRSGRAAACSRGTAPASKPRRRAAAPEAQTPVAPTRNHTQPLLASAAILGVLLLGTGIWAVAFRSAEAPVDPAAAPYKTLIADVERLETQTQPVEIVRRIDAFLKAHPTGAYAYACDAVRTWAGAGLLLLPHSHTPHTPSVLSEATTQRTWECTFLTSSPNTPVQMSN